MIHALTHVDVQPWEGVGEDDLVEHARERAVLLAVHVLDQVAPLLQPALRGAGPPTPALEEARLDIVVAEHVEQPQLARLLIELAEAALRFAPQDALLEEGLEVLVVRTAPEGSKAARWGKGRLRRRAKGGEPELPGAP